ncbi:MULTISPECIES: hypothetical protein [Polymorphospora]|uniref:Uncharacterized protein n=1 Tax=Polymorphospora lycopeni TaxID=3140240 RepID=A0ABV5CJ75_9ACTN
MLVLGVALLAGGLWVLVALRRGRWPFGADSAPVRHPTVDGHDHPGAVDAGPVRAAVRPPESAIYVAPPRGTVYGSGTPPYDWP